MQKELPEHLLTEVCLGAVIDVASALLWMKSTFLFGNPRPTSFAVRSIIAISFVDSSAEVLQQT